MMDYKKWLRREGSGAILMIVLGSIFLALGVHGFRIRPARFSFVDLLGCVVGAFGGFFLLLICDYLLHHARLIFIPWVLGIVVVAAFEPHLSVGLCVSLWIILATQYGS